ncbi:FMN-binding negative transcriptional regulator [Acinetobacter sp. Marseille-Q1618]|uniref:FMN-binding negative transcriptional regulator n=1 Tax=Acinetobacter sp. Marseille-Q1618 TaxID=2697502 RepID=UPI00157036D2|nr:FMN-binding negative transcriptional regulator [Acinetobacter sp. Marseille-Q1618]
MFIAPEFQETRPEEIQRLVQDYPLATIVTQTNQGLIANHIPLLFKSEHILLGHIAKANEMYALITENQNVLVIFKGEDAYISANDYPSKWVDHKKVPTWNYQAVHINGTLKFYDDQKSKLAAVGMLTKIQEQKTNAEQAWKMSDAPKDYIIHLLEDLVVFEIQITRIQAQSKLSQNREATDFDAVIKRLKDRQQDNLAQAMSNLPRD